MRPTTFLVSQVRPDILKITQGSKPNHATGFPHTISHRFPVHGYAPTTGNFQLNLKEVARPTNDACDTAIELETGDEIVGSTIAASALDDVDFDECGTSRGGAASAPGLWYFIMGTGGAIRAEINATYDMQLSVFEGECNALSCLDGTDGEEEDFTAGSVTWDSLAGQKYSIFGEYMWCRSSTKSEQMTLRISYTFCWSCLVHGFVGVVGDFVLALRVVSAL